MTRPTVSDIIEATASLSHTKRSEMTGPRRPKSISNARKVVYFLGRKYGYSTVLIAARLGGIDHSSVVTGRNAAEVFIARFPEFAKLVDDVERLAIRTASDRVAAVTTFLPAELRVAA